MSFAAALDVQSKVVGALIMRELHTRFGRDNIGYLWVIAEPMILAITVTSMHMGTIGHSEYGMDPAPFWITGYTAFVMFRSIVLRAESALEANRSLLYHRVVTITDMLVARCLLEGAGTTLAMFILLGAAAMAGLGTMPERPLLLLEGMFLLLWFSFAMSLLVCAGCEVSPLIARFTHPVVYIMLPVSGVFFLLTWVPEPYRDWLWWFPMIHMFELIREGQFSVYDSPYVSVPYAVAWCMGMTLVGLASVGMVRRRLHLE
jgi:capsular polysaccharide transport system permease protein